MDVLINTETSQVVEWWPQAPARIAVAGSVVMPGEKRPSVFHGIPYALVTATVAKPTPGSTQKHGALAFTVDGLTVTAEYTLALRPDADVLADIKREAGRRIYASSPLVESDVKQRNTMARGLELVCKVVVDGGSLTQDEAGEVAAALGAWGPVKTLRAKSNALEAAYLAMSDEQKAAFDPADDSHWT